jgi:hypothetical protein
MLGLLGGPDTVTGTVAPYLHSIPLLNSVNIGSQPPSYSLLDYDLIQQGPADAAKLVNTALIDTISLDFAATGALSYSLKYIGAPFVETGPPVGYSISSEVLVPAYNGVITIGGSAPKTVISGSLAMKRNTDPIFTIGAQGPNRIWSGPITITGKFMILSLKTDQTMSEGLIYDKLRVAITFTDVVAGHSVTFLMTQVQFKNPVIDRSKTYVQSQVEFSAEANTKNAVSGFSPLKFQASTAQASAY